MTNYKRKNYRKIYEDFHGKIPFDEQGRKYDIHHKDGNPENNNLDNLQAVSIQEHYDIHYSQKDWQACHAILIRLKTTADEKSKLASLANYDRVENGTHPFLGGEIQRLTQNRRVQDGTHNFLGLNEKRVAAGTHNFLGEKNPVHKLYKEGLHPFQDKEAASLRNLKRINNGTHHFLDKNFQNMAAESSRNRVKNGTRHLLGGKIQKEAQQKRLENGTHQNLIIRECPHCGKVGKGIVMLRHHFSKCKLLR